jgi:heme A synthase
MLALATAVTVWLLITLGGVVRITGSGMGCGPDWPLCNGQILPPMDPETLIEWSHRLVAALVGLPVLAVAALSFLWSGEGRWRGLRRLSVAGVVLLLIQAGLGAVTVKLDLPASSVILHLGTGMALLAVLVAGAVRALGGSRVRLPDGAARAGWLTAAAGLAVVLLGAFVANLEAAPACRGFPLCNGSMLPAGDWRIQLHWGHRVAAYALVAWALWLPGWVGRRRPGDPAARRTALAAAALAVIQLGLGAAMVLSGLPTALRAAHLAAGAALFAVLVAVATLLSRPPVGRTGVRGT